MLEGALDSTEDVDTYRSFAASDVGIVVFAQLDRDELRGCVFAECNDGGTATIDNAKGTPATSAVGDRGCCAEGAASIEHVCSASDDAIVYAFGGEGFERVRPG